MTNGRNFDGDPNLYAVTAMQGMGKSTVQRELIRAARVDYHFIFDHKKQFAPLLPMFECRTLEHCVAALRQNHAVCFNPVHLYGGKFEEAFEAFSAWVWKVQQTLPHAAPGRRKALFTFDEGGDMLPMAWQQWKEHSARQITNTGREWGLDLCVAAQAPSDLPLKFRNQITHWYVGKLGDEACLEPVKKKGFKWAEIDALQRGQFKFHNGKTGEITDYRTRRES